MLRLHDNLGWNISDPLPVHAEFKWLQEQGNIEDFEMYRTFNMGCGMIIAVDAAVSETVCEWLEDRLMGCAIIGEVVDNGRKVTHIIPGVTFENY